MGTVRIVVLPPRGVNFGRESNWNSLLEGLRQSGAEVPEFGVWTQEPEALVTLNDQPKAGLLQSKFQIAAARSALVALEPRVTSPGMYTSRSLRNYQHRYAASPLWAKDMGGQAFLWPQNLHSRPAMHTETAYAATMINAEKRSAIKGSLYGLRRSAILALDAEEVSLAVIGAGWTDTRVRRADSAARAIAKATLTQQRPYGKEAFSQLDIRPKTALGSIQNKSEAFALAPISIVIENSADYMSEKLIDAICSGVAPVYVGPPLDLLGLPDEIAIGSDPTVESVVAAVQRAINNPELRTDTIAAGYIWLNSGDSIEHSLPQVLTDLGRKIGLNLLK